MDAARLDRRVTFQSPSDVDDGYGGVVPGFGAAYACRARFRYLRTGESVQQMRLAGRQAIAVTVRANATTRTITGAWRMTDSATGHVYNVRGVEILEDRQFLEILVDGGPVA